MDGLTTNLNRTTRYARVIITHLKFDGKTFGMGNVQVTVEAFKGPRPISSLYYFPLRYHQDPVKFEKVMIERGNNFAALEGMKFCVQKGIAFYKVLNDSA